MTVEEFVAFLISRIGLPWEQNDYDGQHQSQCVDYFNIGYQYKEGISPYSRGYGVDSAYQLYSVADTAMVSIPNSDDLQILAGDALIYNQSWGNGDGHVEWALTDSDLSGCDVAGANIDGSPTKPISRKHRTWATMNNGLIGVRRFVSFKEGDVMNRQDVTDTYQVVIGRDPDPSEYAWIGQPNITLINALRNDANQMRATKDARIKELESQVDTGTGEFVETKVYIKKG